MPTLKTQKTAELRRILAVNTHQRPKIHQVTVQTPRKPPLQYCKCIAWKHCMQCFCQMCTPINAPQFPPKNHNPAPPPAPSAPPQPFDLIVPFCKKGFLLPFQSLSMCSLRSFVANPSFSSFPSVKSVILHFQSFLCVLCVLSWPTPHSLL